MQFIQIYHQEPDIVQWNDDYNDFGFVIHVLIALNHFHGGCWLKCLFSPVSEQILMFAA